MSLFTSKPSGILLFFLRLPIHLYKLHLGWLLGHRFLLLTHLGRNSGRDRHTVLEVIRYDASNRESTVIAGWGKKADWFRNIQKAPARLVQTACERFEPVQRTLSSEEAYSTLEKWQQLHPSQAWIFRKAFGLPPDPSEEALRDFVQSHPVITFRPKPLGTRA